ncbi:MAG: hypothetical protein EZS28_013583 [Streblomastix strix]|uniref:Uncharacterized protein n=1 Tax=Streblomastix strix TaxID=222440 RepID=A0A5J4W7P4_9EUKA|nr:MAG: hypothetical protein EZS28_013583 [Streblomastix strix]
MMRESFFDKLSQSCIPANKHDYCFLLGDLNFGMWMEMQRKDIEREIWISRGQSYRFNVEIHVLDTSRIKQLSA